MPYFYVTILFSTHPIDNLCFMMISFSIGVPLVVMVSTYIHSLSYSSMTVSQLLSLLFNIIFSFAFQVAYGGAPFYQRLNDCFSSPLRFDSSRMHVYLAFLLELTTALVLDLPSPRLQAIRTHKLLLLLILYPFTHVIRRLRPLL